MRSVVIASVAPGKVHHGAARSQELPKPASHRINLSYYSGWDSPVLHHSICGQEWAKRSMQKVWPLAASPSFICGGGAAVAAVRSSSVARCAVTRLQPLQLLLAARCRPACTYQAANSTRNSCVAAAFTHSQ